MTDDLVKMARLAQRDDRMSTGALYGDLADRIEELEAQITAMEEGLTAVHMAGYMDGRKAAGDDLLQAAVAAALREAAQVARLSISEREQWPPEDGDVLVDDCMAAILALIPEDAQAALDRVVVARLCPVRSEVVRLSAEGKIDNETTERLLAAIRAQGET